MDKSASLCHCLRGRRNAEDRPEWRREPGLCRAGSFGHRSRLPYVTAAVRHSPAHRVFGAWKEARPPADRGLYIYALDLAIYCTSCDHFFGVRWDLAADARAPRIPLAILSDRSSCSCFRLYPLLKPG